MGGSIRSWLRPAIGLAALSLTLCPLLTSAAPTGRSAPIPPGAHVAINGATATLMRANGETGTFQCTCNKGRGACRLTRQPSSMICDNPGGAGACTGDCVFFTGTTGVAGAARGAAAPTSLPAARAP